MLVPLLPKEQSHILNWVVFVLASGCVADNFLATISSGILSIHVRLTDLGCYISSAKSPVQNAIMCGIISPLVLHSAFSSVGVVCLAMCSFKHLEPGSHSGHWRARVRRNSLAVKVSLLFFFLTSLHFLPSFFFLSHKNTTPPRRRESQPPPAAGSNLDTGHAAHYQPLPKNRRHCHSSCC